jgi:cobalt-zinc-cadmium efflux system membrane fusion protein
MNRTLLLIVLFAAAGVAVGCGGSDRDSTTTRGGTLQSETDAGSGAAGAHGSDAGDAVVATCTTHGADASLCYFCDASLRDPARLWCKEHNRYEDRCFLCHPELRDASRLYCNEHGTYEDECFICHPELVEGKEDARNDDESNSTAGAEHASAAGGLYCREHDVAESECGICHPELADQLEPGGSLKIRFPSAAAAGKAGVGASHPSREPGGEVVQAVGELGYNLNRLIRVTPLVDGVVRSVHADLGDEVDAGAELVTIASRAIASAKAEYLAAIAEHNAAQLTLERETELFGKQVSPESDLIAARAALATAAALRAAAEQNLLDLGFTPMQVTQVARGESPGSSVTLRAPFAGTVVARNAVSGDVVSIGTELLRLADLSELWVTIAIAEHEAVGLKPGQRVEVHSRSTGLKTTARVTWVASHLNETTRMAEMRATIINPSRAWKAGMFVDVRIELGVHGDELTIPSDAIHRFGGQPFVFVDLGDGLYAVRRIQLAGRSGNRAFVAAGISDDDRIVTAQSFLVKSEFQKSRLGAGCVH